MIPNPCSMIEDQFDNVYGEFTDKSNQTSDIINQLKNNTDIFPTEIDQLQILHTRAGKPIVKTNESVNEIRNATENMTGSCLDGVFNGVGGFLDDIDDFMSGIFDGLNDVLDGLGDFISDIFSFSGLCSDLNNLLPNVDELLGCLSESDCLPTGEVDDIIGEINNITKSMPYIESGNCDENLLDNLFKGYEGPVDEVKSLVEDIVKQVEDAKINTEETFQEITSPDQGEVESNDYKDTKSVIPKEWF